MKAKELFDCWALRQSFEAMCQACTSLGSVTASLLARSLFSYHDHLQLSSISIRICFVRRPGTIIVFLSWSHAALFHLYQYLCCQSGTIIVFLSWLLITPWPLLSPFTHCVGASQCSPPWPLFCLSVLNFNPVWVSIKSSAGSCRLWKLFSASKQCVAKVLFQTQWKQYSTTYNMESCSHTINGIQGCKLWSRCDLG